MDEIKIGETVIKLDHDLKSGETLWIKTHETLIAINTFSGTSVVVYEDDHNPVVTYFRRNPFHWSKSRS